MTNIPARYPIDRSFFKVAQPKKGAEPKTIIKPFQRNDIIENPVESKSSVKSIANKDASFPKILFAITSYNRPSYIDLSLHFLSKWKNDFDIIVIDDCSKNSKYNEVCAKYGVPLIITDKHHSNYGSGDVLQTVIAIEYAKQNGYDYVVKQSQRWICMENPSISLKGLIEKHPESSTFTNSTKSFNIGFRTEFFCMKISDWIKFVPNLKEFGNRKSLPMVEAFVHGLSKRLQKGNGFTTWDWMGTDRRNPPPYILWHDRHSPKDYQKVADSLSLNIENF